MKSKLPYVAGFVTLTLLLPAAADVIYSGLLDYTIPTTFTGLTVNVGDGTLNPFFGGVGVANNAALQPLRDGTGGLDTILNLGTAATIDGSSLYLSTGDGGSLDHVGAGSSQFNAGATGYLGFQLDATKYGWMRVVFTNNTSTPVLPVVKDWAYDNTTGKAITTGNIVQSAVASGAQTVTLTSATGESFTLGTQITNALGNTGGVTNSVVKQGAGTAILTGTNSYSGTTAVSNGMLLVNGSKTGGGLVDVSGGKLGGTGTISGAVTIGAAGTLAPTAQAGGSTSKLTLTSTVDFTTGSIFEWELNTTNGTDPGVVSDAGTYGQVVADGAVTGAAVFKVVLGSNAFADAFWDTNKTWTNVFTGSGVSVAAGETPATLQSLFTSFHVNGLASNAVAGRGSFAFNGSNTLTWTAVPEPSTALAALLLGAGLLRRRR